MTKSTRKNPARALREQGARYVVGTQGQPIAVLLTLEEYDRHLDLLDDETDSQNADLAARLARASTRPVRQERLAFREHKRRREDTYRQTH